MQNDLISRSERLRKIRQTEPDDYRSAMLISDAKKMIRTFIEEAPAVKAVPVEVLGEWGKLLLPYKGDPHGPVVRFSDQAIFETPIDFEPMRIFYEAAEEFERKCKWLYHCYISDERRKKIKQLLPFADKDYGWVKLAKKAIDIAAYNKLDWRTKKELLAEFGDESED